MNLFTDRSELSVFPSGCISSACAAPKVSYRTVKRTAVISVVRVSGF